MTKNLSFLVGGTVFLLFGLFILFFESNITTNAVQVILEKDSYSVNQFLDGNVKLILESGDFVPADAMIELTVKTTGGEVRTTKSMSVSEYFSKAGAGSVQRTTQNNVEGYNLPATYVVDMVWFGIIVSQPENYILEAKLKKNDQVLATSQLPIHIIESAGPQIVNVGLYPFNEEGLPMENENKFMIKDTLGCFAAYEGNMTDFSAKIYSFSDNPQTPAYQFTINEVKLAEIDITGRKYLGAVFSKEVDVYRPGQWACAVTLTNSEGSTTRVSQTPLTQINSQPFKLKDLPKTINLDREGYVLNEQGTKEPLNLRSYYKDSETDIYNTSILPNPEKAVFDKTKFVQYSGNSENIYFVIADTETFIVSDAVKLSGGIIQSSSGACVPSWECTDFGPCINYQQTRVCYDKMACGVFTGKPLESQSCTTPYIAPEKQVKYDLREPLPSKSPNILSVIIIILVLFVMAAAGAYLMYKNSKKTIESSASHQSVQRTETPKEHIHKLVIYVDTMMKKGYDLEKVKDTLKKVGWPHLDVETAARYVTLKNYVNENLKKGVKKEILREALIKKGWKKELIDEVL